VETGFQLTQETARTYDARAIPGENSNAGSTATLSSSSCRIAPCGLFNSPTAKCGFAQNIRDYSDATCSFRVDEPRCRRKQGQREDLLSDFFWGSGQTYVSRKVKVTVNKKTAQSGCAGQILCVIPSIHAPVPIMLASNETFRLFMRIYCAKPSA